MAQENSTGLFCSIFNSGYSSGKSITAAAVAGSDSFLSTSDFIHEINPLTVLIDTDSSSGFLTSTPDLGSSLDETGVYEQVPMKVVGYLIEKVSLAPDGTESITYLTSPFEDGTTLIDSAVTYGYAYKYRVRTCVYAEIEVINRSLLGELESQYMRAGTLLLSRASPSSAVRCTDETPPPPPPNLDFIWNYSDETLTLVWEHPVVPQNDVKHFQVLRRGDTTEAFSLLKEFNFDNSADQWIESEGGVLVDTSLLEIDLTGASTNIYTDESFDKDSSYIYAVACKDARKLTSSLSAQFLVEFNRYKNQIVVTTISQSGAPKCYPNFYLNESLFQDTLTVSDYDHMRVYFDPDFLFLISSTATEAEAVLATASTELASTFAQNYNAGLLSVIGSTDIPRPTYKINIVNTDFQQGKSIDITIRDEEDFCSDIKSALGELVADWSGDGG